MPGPEAAAGVGILGRGALPHIGVAQPPFCSQQRSWWDVAQRSQLRTGSPSEMTLLQTGQVRPAISLLASICEGSDAGP